MTDSRSYNMLAGMRGAIISDCGTYRYLLSRVLQGHGDPLVFIMLNPSTADAMQDDPTIRRCVGFANREGASAMVVINLYAFRATEPQCMFIEERLGVDIVGPQNNEMIRKVVGWPASRVVCAWGAAHHAMLRAREVERILRERGAELVCLGTTGKGMPRHPLYVKSDQPLVPYTGS